MDNVQNFDSYRHKCVDDIKTEKRTGDFYWIYLA
jgi:hypothetical protein